MKKLLLITMLGLAVNVSAQQHVQAELDEVLRHSDWVTHTNQSERSEPGTGTLLKRNIEYRLSLPADGGVVERMTAAFEADCEQAYTYVRTSAEYNKLMAIRRPIEMRLQNDVRLEAGSTEYSYLLLNVLNQNDTRFRTTTIFLWRPESGGRIDARVYVLYGVVISPTQTTKESSSADIPAAPTFESVLAGISTPVRREIVERDPQTRRLNTYTRSIRVSSDEARSLVKAMQTDRSNGIAYSYSESGSSTYRITAVVDSMRMAYVLVNEGSTHDVHAVYGPMPYSERVSDLVADEQAHYTIANKGRGLYLGIDPQTHHAVTADRPQPVKFLRLGDHYVITAGNRALTDTRTWQVGGNYALTWEPIERSDLRQRWIIVRHGDHYNLVNVATKQTANLANGAREAGSPIISYTTNHRNAISPNRLWQIEKQ